MEYYILYYQKKFKLIIIIIIIITDQKRNGEDSRYKIFYKKYAKFVAKKKVKFLKL